jgi:hypothetical protein
MILAVSNLTWCGSHTDKSSRIAEAATAVGLVGRGRVVVESEVRLAWGPLHADRVTTQRLAFITLTQLRAFWFVLPIQLKQFLVTSFLLLSKRKLFLLKCDAMIFPETFLVSGANKIH